MQAWKAAAATAALVMMGAPVLAETPAQLEANKKIVVDMYTQGLQKRNMAVVTSYLADDYIQHNPIVPTGKAGFIKFWTPRWADPNARPPEINKIELVMAEKDLVTIIFKRPQPDPDQPGKTYDTYWFDTFRVNNGKITEHWDALIKAPPGSPVSGGPPAGR